MKRSLSYICIALAVISSHLFAQGEHTTVDRIEALANYQRAGQTSMPFLAFGAGARMQAMGDAGLAQGGDASALFYNPAGIVHLEQNSVMLSSMNWLHSVSQ